MISLWSTAPYLSNNSVGHEDNLYHVRQLIVRRTDDPYKTAAEQCPSTNPDDPSLPCVENRLRQFDRSIHEMLYPERRRGDPITHAPGYMYRTTAPTCLKVPAEIVTEQIPGASSVLHWIAPWAFQKDGGLALGPLPKELPDQYAGQYQASARQRRAGHARSSVGLGARDTNYRQRLFAAWRDLFG